MAKITKGDRGTLRRVIERRFDLLKDALTAKHATLDEEYTREAVATIVPKPILARIKHALVAAKELDARLDAITEEVGALDLHVNLPSVYGGDRDGLPYGNAVNKEVARLREADGFADISTALQRLREKKATTLDEVDVASLTGQDCQNFLDAIPTVHDLLAL